MLKIINLVQSIISWVFSKIFNVNWNLEDTSTEDEKELTDDDYANCRRHGGVASIINCWECSAEAQEDNEDAGREDDQDD